MKGPFLPTARCVIHRFTRSLNVTSFIEASGDASVTEQSGADVAETCGTLLAQSPSMRSPRGETRLLIDCCASLQVVSATKHDTLALLGLWLLHFDFLSIGETI